MRVNMKEEEEKWEGKIGMREVSLLQASRAVNRGELAGLLNAEIRNAKFANLDEQGDDEGNSG